VPAGHVLGVLVQANFGGVLTMDGVPVGKELGRHAFAPRADRRGAEAGRAVATRTPPGADPEQGSEQGQKRGGEGSCIIVVATDAPLEAKALKRLAARALFGLARTGSSYSNGSGDFVIAFSVAPAARFRHGSQEASPRTLLPTDALDPLFEAALEATEEAVYNALLRATTVTGSGHTTEALPIDRLREILRKYGRGR
jgi:D-aminopeptidase